MITFLQIFFNLCLFRGQVHDIPRSEKLLLITAIIAVVLSAINSIPNVGLIRGLMMSIAQVLLLGLLLAAILKIRNLPERTMQTLTGIYGTTVILQIISLPFFGWHERVAPSGPEALMVLSTPLIITAGISIWSICVMTSVLRQALETSLSTSLMFIIGCQFLIMFMIIILLGNPPA